MLIYEVNGRKGISSAVFYFRMKGGERYYFDIQDERRKQFQRINIVVSGVFLSALFLSIIFNVITSAMLMYGSMFFFMFQIVNFLVPKRQFKDSIKDAQIIGVAPPRYILEWFFLYVAVLLILYQSLAWTGLHTLIVSFALFALLGIFALLPLFEAIYYRIFLKR